MKFVGTYGRPTTCCKHALLIPHLIMCCKLWYVDISYLIVLINRWSTDLLTLDSSRGDVFMSREYYSAFRYILSTKISTLNVKMPYIQN